VPLLGQEEVEGDAGKKVRRDCWFWKGVSAEPGASGL
jgi:hypothetical protein